MVQKGVSASSAKVFKAHAVPQGLCENLINALKLLANQQNVEMAQSRVLWQVFVKEAEKELWRVGHLNEGVRSFEVRGPKLEEGCSEVSIREGPEELTLRAEEVGSQKACSNVGHIAEDRWGPPLVDADWHASCQAMYKGIEGSEWSEVNDYYKEMRKAARVKKPHGGQKARALWKMKAARETGDDFYDPERKDNFLGRSKTRDWNCGKSTSKTQLWLWTKL